MCKFYSILDSNQIFESIKNNFEEKKDSIYITKQTINITLNMSINILAEKIYLYIPLLQKSKDDEIKNLKESIYFLNKEKNNLKEEIISIKEKEKNLNEIVKELQNELKDV